MTISLTSDNPTWYKDAIFYEVHVKSFYDSNGDGIGDLEGLRQKLDYLQELGVDCLWILPFYVSPLKDDGYDIADYYNINPQYGTIQDFKRLLKDAHRRNIRVITDFVMNHTSEQNMWFQEARKGPSNPYHNYYVWSDTDRRYKDARIIFIDTEKSNWTWDNEAKKYYWHRFFSHQPDLNFDNSKVHREVERIVRYWMDFGLDGFRLDAIPYLFEREGTNGENLPETHAYLKKLRRYIDQRYKNKVLLAEANQWPIDVRPYFGEEDDPEMHMAFNFPLMPRIFMALRREERTPIVDIMRQLPAIPESCQWGIFLRNHDELTLEMVTDEERDYMYYEYAKDPRYKLNLGIRRRLAPLVDNSRRRIELLNSLLLSLAGSPIIYYGDEIGMGDNVYLGDRDGVRTPMQWDGGLNAGFSEADSARLYSPVISDPVYGYQSVNVKAQQRSSSSLLNWMKRMIRLRKQHPVFGRGGIEFLESSNLRVLTYLRSDGSDHILCVCNLSRFVQPCELDMRRFNGATPIELIGATRFPPIGELPYFLTLGPHDFYWFKLEMPHSEG